MATNENLPQTLVDNLIANGYTPRTPEEWIYSAIDYLHQNAVTPSPPGAATWGSIAGTLSNQTDLNTALGLKAPAASPVFTGVLSIPVGAVGAPSIAQTGALTTGIFFPSTTQGAFTSSGAIVGGWNATGLFAGVITEQVVTAGVTIVTSAGSILLRPDAGWSAPTGTIGKATFDASAVDTILNPTADLDARNFIRTISGVYDALITQGFFTP